MPLLKVSFCESTSNYLPVKPQIVSYYEVTTTTYSSDISFADAGPLARASNSQGGVPANPFPLVALRATKGDRAQKAAERLLKHMRLGMLLLSHFVDFNVNLYLRKKKENGKYMRNENMELHFMNVLIQFVNASYK